ncbi:MAG: NifB/NifX family molybdenum-iron cluster-binding protein [Synergistetes bacterium]|nr:MAG: Dinitrogenase iron-molybdenum cofactor biosynthesis protein [bacterium 42_11]MBC7331203.1 NifB/NifX family molybdenum-iron cluster-binding protein [Synergistota bacterium]MDK2871500.1 hypothetical protein [bacterium]
MGKRIVVPVLEDKGLDSKLSAHFGRSPYFAVVDIDESGEVIDVKVEPNRGEHFGGGRKARDIVLAYKPDSVIVLNIGPGAIAGLREAGVKVFRAKASSLRETVLSYWRGELEELDEACENPRHEGMHKL